MSKLTPRWLLNRFLGTSALLFGIGLWNSLFSLPMSALDLGDGKTTFERSPLLVRSATSFRGPAVIASYQFTITIPEDAGEPLQAVTIVQQPNLETIIFGRDRTSAFLGDSFNGGTPVAVVEVEPSSAEDNQVKVVFEPPVEPGNTVTISLRGRNPLYGGIYQFGITVFPVGENSPGLYLGVGRLHFSSPGGRGG